MERGVLGAGLHGASLPHCKTPQMLCISHRHPYLYYDNTVLASEEVTGSGKSMAYSRFLRVPLALSPLTIFQGEMSIGLSLSATSQQQHFKPSWIKDITI